MSTKRGGYNKVGGTYTPYSTAWRIVCAIRDHKCLNVPAITKATGICHQSVEREIGRLEWSGYLKTRPYRLTDKGLALANGPCPERAPKAPPPAKPEKPAPAPVVEDDGPLPASVVVTARGMELLRILGAEANAGRAPTITWLAEQMGGSMTSLLARLRVLGLVALVGKAPTRLGRAVLSGLVKAVPFKPTRGRLAAPFGRPVESAPAPVVVEDKPLVPPSFATRGGIRHPSLDSLGYKPGRAAPSIAGWS